MMPIRLIQMVGTSLRIKGSRDAANEERGLAVKHMPKVVAKMRALFTSVG